MRVQYNITNRTQCFYRSETKNVYLQSVHHHKEEEKESGGKDESFQEEAFQYGEWSRGWEQQLQQLVEVMTKWTCEDKPENSKSCYYTHWSSFCVNLA